jgi:hypothetical protein
MNLINLLVKDIVPFAAQNKLDLLFIIKLIDYRLATIEVNIEDEYELDTYIQNIRILNSLFILMGLATNYSDLQRKAYDNESLKIIVNEPSRLEKYKTFKLSIIEEHSKEDIIKFKEYISSENESK